MCEHCNILCCKKDRRRGPCNEVRLLEFALCIICLSCGLIALACDLFDPITEWFFMPLLAVPVTYGLITFIDIIATWAFFPIGWRAWIMFSVGGALLFFLCVGLSPLLLTSLYFLYTILYVITALVFLTDGLCIVSMIRTLRLGSKGRCCNQACETNKSSQIAPLPISSSFSQTEPAQQPNYGGSSVGGSSAGGHPQYQKLQPYYGGYQPEKEGARAIVTEDAKFAFPMANMMGEGEPCPPPASSKVEKSHYKKYKEIDLTPLKNPFLAEGEYK